MGDLRNTVENAEGPKPYLPTEKVRKDQAHWKRDQSIAKRLGWVRAEEIEADENAALLCERKHGFCDAEIGETSTSKSTKHVVVLGKYLGTIGEKITVTCAPGYRLRKDVV